MSKSYTILLPSCPSARQFDVVDALGVPDWSRCILVQRAKVDVRHRVHVDALGVPVWSHHPHLHLECSICTNDIVPQFNCS